MEQALRQLDGWVDCDGDVIVYIPDIQEFTYIHPNDSVQSAIKRVFELLRKGHPPIESLEDLEEESGPLEKIVVTLPETK